MPSGPIIVRVEGRDLEPGKHVVDVGDIGQDQLSEDAAIFWALVETARLYAGRLGIRIETNRKLRIYV